jgi:glycosyltransferase involved in cell wall biosynthesis
VSGAPIPTFLDLRCLQDPDYATRGIGFHVASLLRHGAERFADRLRLVGLIDAGGEPLPEEIRVLLSEVRRDHNPVLSGAPSVFVSASPMTHDPSLLAAFVGRPRVHSAAIVYDFIPWDRPGYLVSRASRLRYRSRLAWLRLHDHFLPISHYAARRLRAICDIPAARVTVTGACVRSSFFTEEGRPASGRAHRRGAYVVVVGGEDRRKNVDVVIRALERLHERDVRVSLKIVGRYSGAGRAELSRVYGRAHDAGTGLEFVEDVSDAELADLYRGAAAAVAPSRIEGFSLPVAEANGCGCPVFAADCDAHRELVHQKDALFDPDDFEALAASLERALADDVYRSALAARQSIHGRQFQERHVADRFWTSILERGGSSRATPRPRPRRPSAVALLTPYPPQESGVATFSERTVEALRPLCDVDVYTSAPSDRAGARRHRLVAEPLLSAKYDAVVSVLGNSRYHRAAFDFFEAYGGPAILHDARLLYYYRDRLPDDAFLAMAAGALGRPVRLDEVQRWCRDERTSPSSFLHGVVARARPLIVHTRALADRIEREHGVRPVFLAPAPIEEFGLDELSDESRRRARERLGVTSDAVLLATFGIVHRDKAWPVCVRALARLRAREIRAELHFVGPCDSDLGELRELARALGVEGHVRAAPAFRSREEYRDSLLAADAAIQLRTYERGQYSAALADCISAGLPTVANEGLADAVDAPSSVARVPDRFDASVVAERVAELVNGVARPRLSVGRDAYLAEHSFTRYAAGLLEVLGVPARATSASPGPP